MKHTFILFLAALMLVGCENATLILSSTNLSLSHDEKQTISAIGASDNIVWTTSNDFVADVENGVVTGNHIGECAIKAKSDGATAICQVAVKPKYFTYQEPILDWGITLKQLQARKGKYDEHNTSNGKDLYSYIQDENKGIIEVYTFGNGVLENCAVLLNVKNTTVVDFLNERYELAQYDSGTGQAIFINSMKSETATLAVGFRPVTSGSNAYIQVIYIPYSD